MRRRANGQGRTDHELLESVHHLVVGFRRPALVDVLQVHSVDRVAQHEQLALELAKSRRERCSRDEPYILRLW